VIRKQLDWVVEAAHRIFADAFEIEIAFDEVGERAGQQHGSAQLFDSIVAQDHIRSEFFSKLLSRNHLKSFRQRFPAGLQQHASQYPWWTES
jgi:hypothetical protein